MALKQAAGPSAGPSAGNEVEKGGIVALEPKEATAIRCQSQREKIMTAHAGGEDVIWVG